MIILKLSKRIYKQKFIQNFGIGKNKYNNEEIDKEIFKINIKKKIIVN